MNTTEKSCQNCSQKFVIEPEDISFYEKMKVPFPTWCPECRMQRRFAFRNERKLFKRFDAHTNKEVFSGIPPEANVHIFENSYWHGDEWDPLDYGKEYDFSRPFFEQWQELLAKVPLPAKSVYTMQNSDYCNEASECKNCYLCFNVDFLENSGYLVKATNLKDSFDCYEVAEDELCYECVMVYKSYRTFFSFDCESCTDIWFSKGLRGCSNCFGCVNLKNKSYYFFNEPLSKEEYIQKLQAFASGSYKEVFKTKKQAENFWLRFPNKYYHGFRNTAVSGECIFDSKNVADSFSVLEGEHLRYCQIIIPKVANSYDCTIAWRGSENMYDSIICGDGCYNIKFCMNCWNGVRDLDYCFYTINSSNCFGCISLQKKEYCILNKQYSKEEYFELKEKIVAHMNDMPYIDSKNRVYKYGEFFPVETSCYAYNESLAQDFFPLDKSAAGEKGFLWREASSREFNTTQEGISLADRIDDVQDDIVQEVIACANCEQAYRIVPLELQFLRKMKLPLPHMCHNCRFLERFKFINKPVLYDRACMCSQENHTHTGKCSNEFRTSYKSEQPEIVYCEACYQSEVV